MLYVETARNTLNKADVKLFIKKYYKYKYFFK